MASNGTKQYDWKKYVVAYFSLQPVNSPARRPTWPIFKTRIPSN
jgi:hypothetical protein